MSAAVGVCSAVVYVVRGFLVSIGQGEFDYESVRKPVQDHSPSKGAARQPHLVNEHQESSDQEKRVAMMVPTFLPSPINYSRKWIG